MITPVCFVTSTTTHLRINHGGYFDKYKNTITTRMEVSQSAFCLFFDKNQSAVPIIATYLQLIENFNCFLCRLLGGMISGYNQYGPLANLLVKLWFSQLCFIMVPSSLKLAYKHASNILVVTDLTIHQSHNQILID